MNKGFDTGYLALDRCIHNHFNFLPMHLLKFNKVQFVCYAFSKIAGLTKYHEFTYFQGY